MFINKAYEVFFSVTSDRIKGKTIIDLKYIPVEDRIKYNEEDRAVVDNTLSISREYDYVDVNGKIYHCLYFSSGFYYEEDDTRGLIGLIVDISRREKVKNELFKKVQELTGAYSKMEDISITDHLTGLKNRRSFTKRIKNMINNIDTYSPFCLVMFDLDFFKKVNDTYGHAAGDTVLKVFSNLLKKVFRQNDHIFRWGGEEFLVLLTNIEVNNATIVANRLREKMKNLDILNNGQQITVSGGIAQYFSSETIESLLKRTDEALYEAKSTGRDRIVIWNMQK